ncbi:MAG: LL-diaminopimelate aminotransferase [Spirochaetaceae bacterium]|nr:LL-diaminopimelate aminotransferase [Spirochaetaceae bacterium]
MAEVNKNYKKLAAGYLFPEIARRTREFQEKHPDIILKKLGIGNTTEVLSPSVIDGLKRGVNKLASVKTYTGYGDEQGKTELRRTLAEYYKSNGVDLTPEDFFISDGAKPDSSNIQSIFASESIIAVQDPAYPVYVDSNVIAGRTGVYSNKKNEYEELVYMSCTEKNYFFPDVPDKKVDLIYLCSPNNPTGAVATHEQLQLFVDYALKNKSVIIFDAAYCEYISDPDLPRSIFEIDGAKQCSLEINSLSKFSGFTGVRLGWTVVPEELVVEGSKPGEVRNLWNRRQCTFFNGASNIVQEGALAVFSKEGLKESKELVDYYMNNAKIIMEGIKAVGLKFYGGVNSPYVWLKTPKGISSWDFFDKLLSETGVIGTPGSGFGPGGEGFFRLSAFGHREDIETAMESIKDNLKI